MSTRKAFWHKRLAAVRPVIYRPRERFRGVAEDAAVKVQNSDHEHGFEVVTPSRRQKTPFDQSVHDGMKVVAAVGDDLFDLTDKDAASLPDDGFLWR